MFPTIIIFIIILAILIFVHELGHFIAAKRSGVKVEEFGFGFPPRLFGVKKGETTYSLNLIPLGGFVKIYGEQGEGKGEENSFISKSIARRTLIISAGVLMNFALAAFLLGVGYKIGLPTVIEDGINNASIRDSKVQITNIAVGSPAENAGLKIGDVVKTIKLPADDGRQIVEVEDVQNFVDEHKGQEVVLQIERGKDVLEARALARENPPAGEGPLGIALAQTGVVSYSFFKSFTQGVADTVNLTVLIIVALAGILYKLVVGMPVGDIVTGPVGIYSITSQAAELGFVYLLQLTVLLSINLGIINILPFPALDGGRLLFLGIEKIKGKPVSPKVENFVHTLGFVLLIFLMVLVTYRDLTKLF